ncbi:MAG: hypothetical protein HZB44_08445 [Actinobacteria bacterium]|nr:hypothetical protein [Actinomycetota bacterium]
MDGFGRGFDSRRLHQTLVTRTLLEQSAKKFGVIFVADFLVFHIDLFKNGLVKEPFVFVAASLVGVSAIGRQLSRPGQNPGVIFQLGSNHFQSALGHSHFRSYPVLLDFENVHGNGTSVIGFHDFQLLRV